MVEQSAAFHRTKHIKLHDNMAQIILPYKIKCMGTSNEIQYHHEQAVKYWRTNCMGTSDEIQYHLTDSMPKEVRNSMGTSNEIQNHPFYFLG